jgi:hypothetical protein
MGIASLNPSYGFHGFSQSAKMKSLLASLFQREESIRSGETNVGWAEAQSADGNRGF